MDSVFSRAPARLAAMAVAVLLAGAGAPAHAAGTPPEPSAPQPSLPPPNVPAVGKPPVSPVVEHTIAAGSNPADAGTRAARHEGRHRAAQRRSVRGHSVRRHLARHDRAPPLDVERPAVAGVTLLVPLPRPLEPPHLTVPLPAYPFESLAAFVTTPPPPVVCHRVPREPDLPDPGLYRERTLQCLPDDP